MDVLWILFGICGAVYCIMFLKYVKLGIESKNWPNTKGTIKQSFLDEQWSPHSVAYEVKIQYEYSIKLRKYSNHTLAFLNQFSFPRKEQAEIAIFPWAVGNDVFVYYHPKKPTLSVLKPGLQPDLLHIIFFLYFLLFVALALVALIRIVIP